MDKRFKDNWQAYSRNAFRRALKRRTLGSTYAAVAVVGVIFVPELLAMLAHRLGHEWAEHATPLGLLGVRDDRFGLVAVLMNAALAGYFAFHYRFMHRIERLYYQSDTPRCAWCEYPFDDLEQSNICTECGREHTAEMQAAIDEERQWHRAWLESGKKRRLRPVGSSESIRAPMFVVFAVTLLLLLRYLR